MFRLVLVSRCKRDMWYGDYQLRKDPYVSVVGGKNEELYVLKGVSGRCKGEYERIIILHYIHGFKTRGDWDFCNTLWAYMVGI